MMTISLCMIVKNEEKVLARCLDSVKDVVDEIIIVDTGSDDKTKEIASQYASKIYDFTWQDDFSAARNFSFSKATKDYQLWLDADDVLLELDAQALLALKRNLDKDVDIVTFKYAAHFNENNEPVLTFIRGRLFKRSNNYNWNDPVHEYIVMSGNIFHADIYVTNKKETRYTDRNLKIYEKLLAENKKLSPRSMFYYARELKNHGQYEKAVVYFEMFLDTKEGCAADNISACFNLNFCYKMINYSSKRIPVLLKSFEYSSPRAEICCGLGELFMENDQYKIAKEWYKIAFNLTKSDEGGFVLNDYWDYIPSIQLCVCNYRLGNVEEAVYYNEQAAKCKPDSPAVLYNKKFFQENLHKQ